jgi:hypothetical protein
VWPQCFTCRNEAIESPLPRGLLRGEGLSPQKGMAKIQADREKCGLRRSRVEEPVLGDLG